MKPTPPEQTQTAHMRRALDAAVQAEGRTRPNPVVGCVIAKGETVVSVGFHRAAGEAHAEVDALDAAGADARGADAYVTLEPCNHYGRTPPCTEALIRAGVARVFIGMRDPHPLVDGRGIRRLEEAGIEVKIGVLANECQKANESFSHYVRTRRPFVVGKMAQSLDGRVATRTGQSKWITGEDARARGHALRNTLDAILVGVNTVIADDPQLTCRIEGGRDPVRVILDTHARTPLNAKVLHHSSDAPTWIVVGEHASENSVTALSRGGAEVIRCAIRDGRVWLDDMLVRLGEREILSLLVEGGPTVLGAFRDFGLLDKLYAFVAPKLIGGEDAKSSIGASGASDLSESVELEISETEWVGDDLLLVAYPKEPRALSG